MARKNLTNEIRHDGAADTFLSRQGESLRHWAVPKVESARAWGEVAAAYGQFGGAAAAEEGRRAAKDASKTAKDVTKQYGPELRKGAEQAQKSVSQQVGKVVPAVATGLAAVAPVVKHQAENVQDFLGTLQEQAQQAGQDLQKQLDDAAKDAQKRGKKAKKAKKRGAKKADKATQGLRRDGRKAAKQASRTADRVQGLVADRAGRAADVAGKGGLTAAGLLAAAVASLQEKGQELSPQLQERLEQAGRYAQERRAEFAPAAASRLADAAGRAEQTAHDLTVPTSVEQALIKVTGDKKAVKHLRKGAEKYAKQARKDLSQQARRGSRSGGRGWILAGMAAAATGAGFAVWKLTKPVQDPWAAPVPGPITANIPVVHSAEGSVDPYAKQKQAVAEAGGARTEAIDVRPQVQATSTTDATLANGTPEVRR